MFVNITAPAEFRDRPTEGFEKFRYHAEPPENRFYRPVPGTLYCRSRKDMLALMDYFTARTNCNYQLLETDHA